MMRYGAMNFPIKPLIDEIEDLAGLGFDYVELSLDAPQAHYSQVLDQQDAIRRLLADHGMGLVCHLPTFVFTADLTEGLRRASRREMARSLEAAQILNAEKVVVHPSMISGLGPFVIDLATRYARESMEMLIAQAAELNLTLCLENMFPRYHSFFEPGDFTGILQDHPALKITLDTGHANIDCPKSRRIFNFIETHGDRIGHVHVSDNRGRRDEHLPIGEGTVPWARVMRALRACGYDETMTLEVFSESREPLARSLVKLKSMI